MNTPAACPLDAMVLCACAEAAARAAGRYALDQVQRRGEVTEAAAHDIKLALDRECQARAEERIRRQFPAHGILGEESAGPRPPAEFLWIIDPIDGTVNFHHGLPWWCCSVAVQYRGQTVAGAVFAPVMNEIYIAAAGGPALGNGQPLRVSDTRRLAEAIIATGIDKQPDSFGRSLDQFRILAEHTRKLRILGSAALDICQVACGNADGFFESGIYLWDIAAGALIVQQAGGSAEILTAGADQRVRFAAANAHLLEPLKQVLGS